MKQRQLRKMNINWKCQLSSVNWNFACFSFLVRHRNIQVFGSGFMIIAFITNIKIRMLTPTMLVCKISLFKMTACIEREFDLTKICEKKTVLPIGRGLFFSHFGWLMVKERPEVDEKRRTIDMSDCIADPFVMIQKKWVVCPSNSKSFQLYRWLKSSIFFFCS